MSTAGSASLPVLSCISWVLGSRTIVPTMSLSHVPFAHLHSHPHQHSGQNGDLGGPTTLLDALEPVEYRIGPVHVDRSVSDISGSVVAAG